MGFRMILYISNLLVRDNLDLRPMIQYIRCSSNPSCLSLLWICGFHVSRRSRLIPRYLIVVPWGMTVPLGNHLSAEWRWYVLILIHLPYAPSFQPVFKFYPDVAGGVGLPWWDRCVMPILPYRLRRWLWVFVRWQVGRQWRWSIVWGQGYSLGVPLSVRYVVRRILLGISPGILCS